jgi:hypothetical protein
VISTETAANLVRRSEIIGMIDAASVFSTSRLHRFCIGAGTSIAVIFKC